MWLVGYHLLTDIDLIPRKIVIILKSFFFFNFFFCGNKYKFLLTAKISGFCVSFTECKL